MGKIRKVVITGGGTAGWVAAAALSHQFRDLLDIVLVESEQIGTVGVGESTIPPLRTFHRLLQIDEREFMRAVAATFKLSISYENWLRPGDHYFHPFGHTGLGTWACDFHHFWLDGLRRGMRSELGDFCLETLASRAGRFTLPDRSESGDHQWSSSRVQVSTALDHPEVSYAYQLDAGLYARFLRRFAERHGLRRIEGKIRDVRQHSETGFITALVLEDGQLIEGDLFIDCSGFRGLLIEQALKTGYDDWTHWLPCDRAMAVACEKVGPPTPYTRSTARTAGWQWRIALQHRTGNGHVYSSRYTSDDEAAATLLQNLDGRALGDPRPLRFTTGIRKKIWNRNVVALGLASGFLEPLESTSIYLIQSGIMRLLNLFPQQDFSPVLIDRYNAQSQFEQERIRDFLILHYHVTERDDTPFWDYCRTMDIPESLKRTMALFKDNGQFFRNADELFGLVSWVQVMLGQGIMPGSYHPLVDQMPESELKNFVAHVQQVTAACVDTMPPHQAFIDKYCRAEGV